MAYSYSGLKEFKTCPRKYYENKVLKIMENDYYLDRLIKIYEENDKI